MIADIEEGLGRDEVGEVRLGKEAESARVRG